jgi:hypothetical protein
MLQFNLRPENRDLLVQILEGYLGDLRVEIGDTCDYNHRKKLKEEEVATREILDTLTHSEQSLNSLQV